MQFSYELSAEDIGAAQTLFMRRRRPLFYWGFTVYGVLFFLFGAWEAVHGWWNLAPVPLVVGAWATVFVPVLVPRMARKNWKKSLAMQGPTTLTTTPEGIEVANPMVRSFVRWEVFGSVIENRDVWLLFLSPLNYYVLPTRVFSSEAEQAQFRRELSRTGFVPPGATSTAPLSSP